VCDWIDDMGGIAGKKFQDVMTALADSMNSGLEQQPTKSKRDGVKKLEWIDIERFTWGVPSASPFVLGYD